LTRLKAGRATLAIHRADPLVSRAEAAWNVVAGGGTAGDVDHVLGTTL
jgi:hypothetical protein